MVTKASPIQNIIKNCFYKLHRTIIVRRKHSNSIPWKLLTRVESNLLVCLRSRLSHESPFVQFKSTPGHRNCWVIFIIEGKHRSSPNCSIDAIRMSNWRRDVVPETDRFGNFIRRVKLLGEQSDGRPLEESTKMLPHQQKGEPGSG